MLCYALEAPKLQVWLSQLDIETTDLWGLFKMLDQGDLPRFLHVCLGFQGEGEISLKDFEDGIMRIKGSCLRARSCLDLGN